MSRTKTRYSSRRDTGRDHAGTRQRGLLGTPQSFGVMKLQLGNDRYSWNYQPALAGPGFGSSALNYNDSGSARCNG